METRDQNKVEKLLPVPSVFFMLQEIVVVLKMLHLLHVEVCFGSPHLFFYMGTFVYKVHKGYHNINLYTGLEIGWQPQETSDN